MSMTTMSSIVATKLDVEKMICINDQGYGDQSEIDTCVLETDMTGANRKETGDNQKHKKGRGASKSF